MKHLVLNGLEMFVELLKNMFFETVKACSPLVLKMFFFVSGHVLLCHPCAKQTGARMICSSLLFFLQHDVSSSCIALNSILRFRTMMQ